jgi:hypothetical protein
VAVEIERPLCQHATLDCGLDEECAARRTCEPCWEVQNAACCRRNDKTRCCYCSTYLGYLDWTRTGVWHPVKMRSQEDPKFSDWGRNCHREHGIHMGSLDITFATQ